MDLQPNLLDGCLDEPLIGIILWPNRRTRFMAKLVNSLSISVCVMDKIS